MYKTNFWINSPDFILGMLWAIKGYDALQEMLFVSCFFCFSFLHFWSYCFCFVCLFVCFCLFCAGIWVQTAFEGFRRIFVQVVKAYFNCTFDSILLMHLKWCFWGGGGTSVPRAVLSITVDIFSQFVWQITLIEQSTRYLFSTLLLLLLLLFQNTALAFILVFTSHNILQVY